MWGARCTASSSTWALRADGADGDDGADGADGAHGVDGDARASKVNNCVAKSKFDNVYGAGMLSHWIGMTWMGMDLRP